eukprot:TRINITY_DN31542_c0_g1_i2.p1 TRINITY_DN31542_c0_g1~~TRINITY_DN31542_c0_g1_i2.p1  ORF type:complete len:194 (-),score=28.71 TRINITY_DN31542_c0_g1_i2:279-860(-)
MCAVGSIHMALKLQVLSCIVALVVLLGPAGASNEVEPTKPEHALKHQDVHREEACTGDAPLPRNSTVCFEGNSLGIKVSLEVDVGQGAFGNFSLTFSWNSVQGTCPDIPFEQDGQHLHVNRDLLALCLPDVIGVSKIVHCSDQGAVLVQFDEPLPFAARLWQTSCVDMNKVAALRRLAADEEAPAYFEFDICR